MGNSNEAHGWYGHLLGAIRAQTQCTVPIQGCKDVPKVEAMQLQKPISAVVMRVGPERAMSVQRAGGPATITPTWPPPADT